jgi:hypothetical protein
MRSFCDAAWFSLKWVLVGGGILFSGGLAIRAFDWMRDPSSAPSWSFLQALVFFSLGGGLAVGLVGLACWLASPRGVGWSLGIVVIGLGLFVLFVWPTPYTYYKTETKNVLVRVNRITGRGNYIPPSGWPFPKP